MRDLVGPLTKWQRERLTNTAQENGRMLSTCFLHSLSNGKINESSMVKDGQQVQYLPAQ